jgi:hypothetical protein
LEKKIQVLKSKIENVEKKAGVSGYHEAQTNLEKVFTSLLGFRRKVR